MIDISHRGDIAILTMAHGKANLLDLEFCGALDAAFAECGKSTSKAVVVTGRGSIFSGGVDLIRVVEGGRSYVDAFLPAMNRTFESIFSFPKPVVAAVNGHAIAGGCILVCAADRRLMVRGRGRIGVPELVVGVPFPAVPFEIVRSAVASQHLATLVFGGGTFEPVAAIEKGLVDELVDADRLLDEAIAAAEMLAARPAVAFAMTKSQLRQPALERMSEGAERTDPYVQRLWGTPETLAAIRSYVERTLKK